MGNKEESNEEFLSHPEESEMWLKLIQKEVEKPIVLDPFGGSSTTGVVCKWHNRTYIGIELNPDYCKLGEQRIREGK
jgi:DNA modification methylase